MIAPSSFVEGLRDELRWHRQLDRLAARVRGRRLDRLLQDGVRFTQLLEDRERVVPMLSRALCDGSYRPAPAQLLRVQIGGKEREIARIAALDLLAHAVVAELLAERLEPRLSPHLYSYRPGRSPWQALRALGAFARRHRQARPDPRTRGLYVLRSDIKSYTDSIPLGDDAILWRELARALDLTPSSELFVMVRALLQPRLEREGDPAEAQPRERGLLFGAPTTNVAGNMYMMALDDALGVLASSEGAYARFGDDVLFAHPDPALVRDARARLEAILAERGVEPNRKKLRVLFWNGAARGSAEWPEARGTESVQFLGSSLRFAGTIALAPGKWGRMLTELRARIQRTARLLEGADSKETAKVLAGVVNEALDVRSNLAVRDAVATADLVSDRAQLAQLDYWLARWIAEASLGKSGPRVFRAMPYWWIRRRARLASRVVTRNG